MVEKIWLKEVRGMVIFTALGLVHEFPGAMLNWIQILAQLDELNRKFGGLRAFWNYFS
jgi:hypothetical protein